MNSIEIKNVKKKFRLYHDKSLTLKERILFFSRTNYEELQVLDDISLTIEKGKTVGLIGQNGSGKSTLLKLLTKIIYPDSGEIIINGKVSSLLELGSGFHPDFSGRENIYSYASIFGLSKKKIDERFNEIVEFSELQEYIDNPVRTYSSGMYMRLAFSVAINVDADVLLIDEILAVGDTNFQKKCNNKIKELKRSGMTIVIVTHDTGVIDRICDEAIWIENGKIKGIGTPTNIINDYIMFMGEKTEKKLVEEEKIEVNGIKSILISTEEKIESVEVKQDEPKQAEVVKKEKDPNRWGNMYVEITDVKMLNSSGKVKHVFKHGEEVEIQLYYKVNRLVESYQFGITFWNSDKVRCMGLNTFLDKSELGKLSDSGITSLFLPSLNLVAGEYVFDVGIGSTDWNPYDYQTNRYKFEVLSDNRQVGIFKPNHFWTMRNNYSSN